MFCQKIRRFEEGLADQSTTQLPAEVEALKEELDQKLLQLFKTFEGSMKGKTDEDQLKEIIVSLKDDRETKKSEIIMLRDKLLKNDAEIEMFKDLLARCMRHVNQIESQNQLKNLDLEATRTRGGQGLHSHKIPLSTRSKDTNDKFYYEEFICGSHQQSRGGESYKEKMKMTQPREMRMLDQPSPYLQGYYITHDQLAPRYFELNH